MATPAARAAQAGARRCWKASSAGGTTTGTVGGVSGGRVQVSTAGVDAEVELAGLASRGVAAACDLAIAVVIVALASALLPEPRGWVPDLAGVRGALLALLVVGVPAVGETLWGRSPGKALLGLRVLRTDGRPLDPASAWLRNLVRLVDLLPVPYGVGVVAALRSPLAQRLGDRAATFVVARLVPSQESSNQLRAFGVLLPPSPWPTAPDGTSLEPLVPMRPAELAFARRFLARRWSLAPRMRASAAAPLAARIRARHPAYSQLPDEVVLEQVVASRYRIAASELSREAKR